LREKVAKGERKDDFEVSKREGGKKKQQSCAMATFLKQTNKTLLIINQFIISDRAFSRPALLCDLAA
jgi:hypothetical protein